MMRMIRRSIILAFLLLISCLVFLVFTEPGMHVAFSLAQRFLPGDLTATQLSGRWFSDFKIKNLRYVSNHQQIQIGDLHIDWQPLALFAGELRILKLTADHVDYLQLKSKTPTAKTGTLHLPIKILIYRATISNSQYRSSIKAKPRVITQLNLSDVFAAANQIQFTMHMETADEIAEGKVMFGWQEPYLVDINFIVNNTLQAKQVFQSKTAIKGDIHNLQVYADIGLPYKISISGFIKQVNSKPEIQLNAHWDQIHWPLLGEASWYSRKGKFSITGTASQYAIQLSSQVSHSDWPDLLINLQGKGNQSQLNLSNSTIETPYQSDQLSINGNFNWAKKLAWQLNLVTSITNSRLLAMIAPEPLTIAAPLKLQAQVTHHDKGDVVKVNLNRIVLPQLAITLSNTQLIGQTIAPNLLKIQGQTHSGNGQLDISGQLNLRPFLLKLLLNGKNLLLANNEHYRIVADPKVTLSNQADQLLLAGTIKLPEADIKPHDFSHSINLPDDVIILNDPHEPSPKPKSIIHLTTHLDVILGKKVNVSAFGIQGLLAGQLLIQDRPNESVKASGQLHVVSGRYNNYGQTLKIIQGDVFYNNSPIDNPILQFKAEKTVNVTQTVNPFKDFMLGNDTGLSSGLSTNLMNQVIVGIILTGNLKNPKTQFYSIPGDLSQSDIVSYLILGRPFADAGKADSQLLLSALSSVDAASGSIGDLTRQLQHKIGLDEFSFTSDTYRDPKSQLLVQQPAITLGKAITSRLYLNYTIGLLAASNILQIRYMFSPNWILQTSSSTEANSVDLLYSFEHK